jgi:hypothetical protein
MQRHLIAVGVGIILGCVLVYLTSLVGYSPSYAAGYMQWGIPFQWHSVGTGNGGLTIGPYHYVLMFNLGLDFTFWCALAAVATYALSASRSRTKGQDSLNFLSFAIAADTRLSPRIP